MIDDSDGGNQNTKMHMSDWLRLWNIKTISNGKSNVPSIENLNNKVMDQICNYVNGIINCLK